MEYFEEKLQKNILTHWQQHKIELMYLSFSLVFLLISFGMYYYSVTNKTTSLNNFKEQATSNIKVDDNNSTESEIIVDIAGAVEKPDAYQIQEKSRLKDLLIEAGGLSASADRVFFSRNYNLAKLLIDGEKVYIPSKKEVESGLFQDTTYILSGPDQKNSGGSSNNNTLGSQSNQLININNASQKQLEELPGIGPKTAEKIIYNRPYSVITDLVDKKIVNKGVWEKIKQLITN